MLCPGKRTGRELCHMCIEYRYAGVVYMTFPEGEPVAFTVYLDSFCGDIIHFQGVAMDRYRY